MLVKGRVNETGGCYNIGYPFETHLKCAFLKIPSVQNTHFSISVVKSFWNVARSNSVQDFNTIWQLSNKLCHEIWVWDAFPMYILCCNTQPPPPPTLTKMYITEKAKNDFVQKQIYSLIRITPYKLHMADKTIQMQNIPSNCYCF